MEAELVDCCFPARPEGVECDMLHVLRVDTADIEICCTEADRGSRAATNAACVDSIKPRVVPAPSDGNMLVARECMG